jgi:hypothetical protein
VLDRWEGTYLGQPPAPTPGIEYNERHPLQIKAQDRRSVRLARTAVASAAGMVEHAETYLGDVTLGMEYAKDLMVSLEKARAELHTALSILLGSVESP